MRHNAVNNLQLYPLHALSVLGQFLLTEEVLPAATPHEKGEHKCWKHSGIRSPPQPSRPGSWTWSHGKALYTSTQQEPVLAKVSPFCIHSIHRLQCSWPPFRWSL